MAAPVSKAVASLVEDRRFAGDSCDGALNVSQVSLGLACNDCTGCGSWRFVMVLPFDRILVHGPRECETLKVLQPGLQAEIVKRCNRSEAVKKLAESAKTQSGHVGHQRLTSADFWRFQLFHSFSVRADGARTFQSAGSSSRTTGLRIGCRSAFERCCGVESPRSAICARVH